MFHPDWGIYDMAVGVEVISAYAGPADVSSFEDLGKVSETKTQKITYSESDEKLYSLYDAVREMRENGTVSEIKIKDIFEQLESQYKNDWLLPLELLELAIDKEYSIKSKIKEYLELLKSNKCYKTLIENGLFLLNNYQQA